MEKAILASRRIWAAILAVLATIIPAAGALGIDLPAGFTEALDGIVQALFGTAAAVLALLSKFKPDDKAGAP